MGGVARRTRPRAEQRGPDKHAEDQDHDTRSAMDVPAGPRRRRHAHMTPGARYGSDVVVDLLQAMGVEHLAINPGATYRGLHDSLVNYAGGRPELILTTHEEIAVAL